MFSLGNTRVWKPFLGFKKKLPVFGLFTKDFIIFLFTVAFFLVILFVIFSYSKTVIYDWTLPRSYMELRNWNEPTDYKHLTMFVQQYSIDNICERTPWSEQPIYWYIKTVCAMLEARLDVARPCTLRGVLLCYRVQCVTKTKSAQPFGD